MKTPAARNQQRQRKAKPPGHGDLTPVPMQAAVAQIDPAPVEGPKNNEPALRARHAEVRWLHQNYGVRIEALMNENEALRRRIDLLATTQADAVQDRATAMDVQPSEKLQTQIDYLTAANERYLSRIYELKAKLKLVQKA